MVKVIRAIIVCGLLAGAAAAQPVVSGISNAASQSLSIPGPQDVWATLPNGSIAQGSYFTIYGNNFGADSSVCGSNFGKCYWSPYPLPTQIQGTSVTVTASDGTQVSAYLEFAAQLNGYSQVNAVLPSNTPAGSGTLTVTYNNQTSAPAPINVIASSFGAFSINESGSGPGIVTDAEYNLVTPFHTAKPGQAVILWGTGLGPAPDPATEKTAGPCPSGCDLRSSDLSVTVWVGNQQAGISYAGRAPGYTGEDEIVFSVPNNVTAGCYVSVAVQTGPPNGTQVTSNFTTMAVDPNGAPCRDADGVNMNDIAGAVNSKGYANVASIGLLSNLWNVNLNSSDLFIVFDNDTVDGQIGTFGIPGALSTSRGFTGVPSLNSCTAIAYRGYPPPTDFGLASVKYLDAGPSISVKGPLGTATINKSTGGAYQGLAGGDIFQNLAADQGTAPFYLASTPNTELGGFNITGIATGNYTVTAPGGSAVGSFNGTIAVPSAAESLMWSNVSTFNSGSAPTISRDTPLSISWSGGDPQSYVDITLYASTVENSYPSTVTPEPAVAVECVVPATPTSFDVPTYVLQALPPAINSGSFVSGVVLIGQTSPVTKITPTPNGLDAAYLYWRFIQGYTVQWQ